MPVTELSESEVSAYADFFCYASTCDISDALTRLNLQAVRARGIFPVNQFTEGGPHLAGPATTIHFLPCHYKMQYRDVPFKLSEVVQAVRPGSVIAVDGGRFHKPAQGEMNGLTALRAGAAGTVGDGAVRDIDAVRRLPLPVFYQPYPVGITMETYVGNAICAGVDVPIELAGALIRPGDFVVGDNNGVVVVPIEWCSEVMAITREIQDLESSMRSQVHDGSSWTEIYPTTHKDKYAGANDILP